jgi:hypothetical protein
MSITPEAGDRDDLWRLLSEGLDLCVRARKLDAIDRRAATLSASKNPEGWQRDGLFNQYVAEHNLHYPHAPIETRSLTPALWAQEAYEKDLHEWEQKVRQHLTRHPL